MPRGSHRFWLRFETFFTGRLSRRFSASNKSDSMLRIRHTMTVSRPVNKYGAGGKSARKDDSIIWRGAEIQRRWLCRSNFFLWATQCSTRFWKKVFCLFLLVVIGVSTFCQYYFYKEYQLLPILLVISSINKKCALIANFKIGTAFSRRVNVLCLNS